VLEPESLIPRPRGEIDTERVRSMPLSPADGFVLSRVDGESSVSDLAQATGLAIEDVVASLLKLESLQLVELPKRKSRPPKTPRPPVEDRAKPRNASRAPPVQAPPAPRDPSPVAPRAMPRASAPAPPPSTPSSTAGAKFTPVSNVDLAPEHQAQIATIFAQLDVLDHYALLGVARGTDRKGIKRAYFELTAKFHPDRFFRREIGPFKLQMEAIFRRMTEAHDTLTEATRRSDYDGYLASVEKTRGIEQMVAEAAAEMRRAEEATQGVSVSSIPPPPSSAAMLEPPGSSRSLPIESPRSEPRVRFGNEPPTSPSVGPSAPELNALIGDAISKGPADRPSSNPRISVAPLQSQPPGAQSRRDTLARRLTGSRTSSGPFHGPQAPKVPSIGYAKTEDAVDSLKRRYEDKVTAARTAQARKYSETGMAALEKGDVVAAANSLRVALTFDGENAELKAAYDKAQRASDQILGEQYLKQADYEEKAEKWAEAARSWRRVARAREDDARAHERAAHCLVKAAGNLHDASALAQRAVQLAPRDAAVRVTLANVYLAAGLALNARRELETAAQLAPNDASIASLLKRIGKSD
jgi:curved DNA-binding protein CbpA